MAKRKSPFGEIKSPYRENQLEITTAQAFGARLRDAAKDCQLTQSQLAKALDIPSSTMGRYWNGERLFPAEIMFRASDHLSVDPRWLVTGEHRAWDANDLTIAEIELLTNFRALTPLQQQHVQQSATILSGGAPAEMGEVAPSAPHALHSPRIGYRSASEE
jgi:transcriptional regulator with XRE-family HTH domain